MKKILRGLIIGSSLLTTSLLINGTTAKAASLSNVNANSWVSLVEQIRNTNNVKITLQSDIDYTYTSTTSNQLLFSMTSSSSVEKVIDLNGHNINFINESSLFVTGAAFSVGENTSLTIINSKSTTNGIYYENNYTYFDKIEYRNVEYGAKDGVINSPWIESQGLMEVKGALNVEGANVCIGMKTKGYAISAKGNANVTIDKATVNTYMGYAISVIDTASQTVSANITLKNNAYLGPTNRSNSIATSQVDGGGYGSGALMIRDSEGTTLNLIDATLAYGIETESEDIYNMINTDNYKIVEKDLDKDTVTFIESDFKWWVNNPVITPKYYYYSTASGNSNRRITRFCKYVKFSVADAGSHGNDSEVYNDDVYTYEGNKNNKWWNLYNKIACNDIVSIDVKLVSGYTAKISAADYNNYSNVFYSEEVTTSKIVNISIENMDTAILIEYIKIDVEAPVISNVEIARGSTTTASISFNVDEKCKVYYAYTKEELLTKTSYTECTSSFYKYLDGLTGDSSKIYVKAVDAKNNVSDVYEFTIPSLRTITKATCEHGSVSVKSNCGLGEKVLLSYSASPSYVLDEFVVYKTGDETEGIEVSFDSESGKYYFIAPDYDVTVGATFKLVDTEIAYNIKSSLDELKDSSLYFVNPIISCQRNSTVTLYTTFDGYHIEYFKIIQPSGNAIEYEQEGNKITFVAEYYLIRIQFTVNKYASLADISFEVPSAEEDVYSSSSIGTKIIETSSNTDLYLYTSCSTSVMRETSSVGASGTYINGNRYSTSFNIYTNSGYVFNKDDAIVKINGLLDTDSDNIQLLYTDDTRVKVTYYYTPEKVEYTLTVNSAITDYSLYYITEDNKKIYTDKFGYKNKVYIEYSSNCVISSSKVTYETAGEFSCSRGNNNTLAYFTYSYKENATLNIDVKYLVSSIEVNNYEAHIYGEIAKDLELEISSPFTLNRAYFGKSYDSDDTGAKISENKCYLLLDVNFDSTLYSVKTGAAVYINGIKYSISKTNNISTSNYRYSIYVDTLKHVDSTSSTCNEHGVKEYYYTSSSVYYEDTKMAHVIEDIELWKTTLGALPYSDHDYGSIITGVTADCVTIGTIDHYECSACNKLFNLDKEEIETVETNYGDHNYGSWINEVESTCETKGSLGHYECSICHKYFDISKNELESLEIDLANHTWGGTTTIDESHLIKIVSVNSVVTSAVYGFNCTVCGKLSTETEKATTVYSTYELTTTPTTTTDGVLKYRFADGSTKEYTVPNLLNSFWVIVKTNVSCDHANLDVKSSTSPGVIGTYLQSKGYNAVEYLKIYNAIVGSKVLFVAMDVEYHSYGSINEAVAETCEADGNIAYYKCSDCNKYFDSSKEEVENVVIAAHHTLGDLIPGVASTCTTDGNIAYYKCSECNKYFNISKEEVENVTIGAHHIYGELILGEASTCTTNGTINHYECMECHKLFDTDYNEVASLVIAAHHTYGEWVAIVNATYAKAGMKGHYECQVCHKYFDAEYNEITDLVLPILECSHSKLNKVDKVEATETSYGVKEYYVCKECGKYFADEAKSKEIVDINAWKNNDGKIDKIEPQEPSEPSNNDPETPTNNNDKPENNGKKGLSGGAIAGIVIASVAVASIAGFSLYWFVIRKKLIK